MLGTSIFGTSKTGLSPSFPPLPVAFTIGGGFLAAFGSTIPFLRSSLALYSSNLFSSSNFLIASDSNFSCAS